MEKCGRNEVRKEWEKKGEGREGKGKTRRARTKSNVLFGKTVESGRVLPRI